jgi:hypothetical protein
MDMNVQKGLLDFQFSPFSSEKGCHEGGQVCYSFTSRPTGSCGLRAGTFRVVRHVLHGSHLFIVLRDKKSIVVHIHGERK